MHTAERCVDYQQIKHLKAACVLCVPYYLDTLAGGGFGIHQVLPETQTGGRGAVLPDLRTQIYYYKFTQALTQI